MNGELILYVQLLENLTLYNWWLIWCFLLRLGFAYSNYKEQSLATAFDKVREGNNPTFVWGKQTNLEILYFQLDKDTFVKDCKNVGDTNSESYKKIYWFSWKCFQVKNKSILAEIEPKVWLWQAADADRDGQVSAEEFGTMINVATAAQKRLGLPSPYQTAEEQGRDI